MAFIFRRKQYDPYIPDDIENRIIELDDIPQLDDILQLDDYYNEHSIEPLNENNFKNLYDSVIKGLFIMAIGSMCICFGILCILYKFI